MSSKEELKQAKREFAAKRAALKQRLKDPAGRKTKKRHLKREARKLRAYSKGLQDRKNISDVWFQNLWEESGMMIKDGPFRDRFNEPFPPFIPDCVNFFFKYVIECDDPTHDRPERKAVDGLKDKFFTEAGYTVIRVRSHDYEQFKAAKKRVAEIREARGPIPGPGLGSLADA